MTHFNEYLRRVELKLIMFLSEITCLCELIFFFFLSVSIASSPAHKSVPAAQISPKPHILTQNWRYISRTILDVEDVAVLVAIRIGQNRARLSESNVWRPGPDGVSDAVIVPDETRDHVLIF